jgi:hypothetical protein
MSGVATAIAASAVIGGVVANKNAGDALDAQEDQNDASAALIREQSLQARKDAVPLFDAAQQNREIGTQAALGTQGQSLRQQIDTSARGNYFAQEALLAGQPQVQNAILGLPVDMSQVQSKILHPERNLESMFNQQVPEFVRSNVEVKGSGPLDFTPGGTSNSALADKAFQDGHLSQQQYNVLRRNFADDKANASATNWGSAPNADHLLNKIGANTNPLLAGALSTLFQSIHPTAQPQNQAQLLAGGG